MTCSHSLGEVRWPSFERIDRVCWVTRSLRWGLSWLLTSTRLTTTVPTLTRQHHLKPWSLSGFICPSVKSVPPCKHKLWDHQLAWLVTMSFPCNLHPQEWYLKTPPDIRLSVSAPVTWRLEEYAWSGVRIGVWKRRRLKRALVRISTGSWYHWCLRRSTLGLWVCQRVVWS